MFTKPFLNDEAKKELQGHSEKKNSMRCIECFNLMKDKWLEVNFQ